MKSKFVGSRNSGVEVEESSSGLSSERLLTMSRGGCSASMKACEYSLSRRDIRVDSTGMLPKRSMEIVPSSSLLIHSGVAIDF